MLNDLMMRSQCPMFEFLDSSPEANAPMAQMFVVRSSKLVIRRSTFDVRRSPAIRSFVALVA